MPYIKHIVCLANSWKPPGGRCVAGREYIEGTFGPWVRPVSARSTHELSESERQYRGGREPQLLDLISIPLGRRVPHEHQQEDHELEPGSSWLKAGVVGWDEIQAAVETPDALWINGSSSSNGENDRVPSSHLAGLGRSLYLLRPADLAIAVGPESRLGDPPERRVRAQFRLGNATYRLSVTDPEVRSRSLARPDGTLAYPSDTLVCVSLGEVFNGYAYKLAAGIITRQRAGG